MSGFNNINNTTNLAGMSLLYNPELMSNTIKPEIIEQNLIHKYNSNQQTSNTSENVEHNIISDYENHLNDLMQNNISESSNNIINNQHINHHDIKNDLDDLDDFDKLMNSVHYDKDEVSNIPSNYYNNNDNLNDNFDDNLMII